MIAKNLNYVIRESLPYRMRFGHVRGLILWWSVRRNYKLKYGTPYDVTVPGLPSSVSLRAGTSDLTVFRQVVCSGETDFNLAFEPRFIVDAGANIGLSSIVIAAKYPNCEIVALEVDGSNFELLCQNVAYYANVRPVKKALWGADGYVKISNPTAEAYAFRVIEAKEDDPDAIEAVSLGTLLTESGGNEISLLKLDIEGAELELLQGVTSDWIENTKAIAIELHDRFRPGCTAAFENLLNGRQFEEYQQGEYRVVVFS